MKKLPVWPIALVLATAFSADSYTFARHAYEVAPESEESAPPEPISLHKALHTRHLVQHTNKKQVSAPSTPATPKTEAPVPAPPPLPDAATLTPRDAEKLAIKLENNGRGADSLPYYTRSLSDTALAAAGYMNRGRVYDALGKYDDAIKDFTQSLLIKYDVKVVRAKAIALSKSGKFKEASALCDTVLGKNPGDFETIKTKSTVLNNSQDFNGALSLIQAALTKTPNSIPLLTARGQLYLENQHYSESLQDFNKVLQLGGANSEYIINKADCEFAMKRYAQCIADTSVISKSDVNYPAALRIRANSLVSQSKYAEAAPVIEQLMRLNSCDADALKLKGEVLLQTGKAAAAEPIWQKVLLIDPLSKTAGLLADHYRQIGDKKKGAQIIDESIRLSPRNGFFYWARAMFDTQDKLYEKALDDGLASLKYSPFRANYYTDVAETYLNLNRPADAISILRKMQRLQSNPESDVLCACDAAKAYKTLKQYDNAVNVLSAVIKAYPKNATLYGARGDAYDAAKNDKAAIADYQKAAALEPKKSIYLKYIGNIYLHSKEYDKAIAQYKLAIAAEPHSANGALGMARAYQDMKKYAEALTWCNKALTIAPKYSIIFYTKARILLESGDYRGQLQALNEGVKLSPDDSDFYRSRAMCQLRNIHWKEAYQDADKAVSVDQSCDNYVVRCQVAIALGLMQYAVDDANYALSTACPNPDPDMNAYLQIISATTYTQLKQRDKAAAVLALKPTQTTWPYPIVEWMQGKRSFDSLVATASDNDKKTELYYYLGLKEQADGDNVKAKQHFDWVNKNGTQSYYETTVANALLHNSRTEAQSIVKSISRTIPGIK